eukprot:gene2665-3229_t
MSVIGHNASLSQAPNFAYSLSARKLKERLVEDGDSSLAMDLRSLRHAINAAEPVDKLAMEAFYLAFQQYGLSSTCVVPTYGLAEHTVFVCSGGRQVLCLSKADLEAGDVTLVGGGAWASEAAVPPSSSSRDQDVEGVESQDLFVSASKADEADVESVMTVTGRHSPYLKTAASMEEALDESKLASSQAKADPSKASSS